MATKHNQRTRLTYFDKLQISDKLDRGENVTVLAKEFSISPSSISRIKKEKNKLQALALRTEAKVIKTRKSLKTTSFPDLEHALYIWFHQKRRLGEPITGSLLCEKALMFNEMLDGPKTFKASNGWIDKFKQRHGIRQLSIKEEKLSNTEAADHFKETFVRYVTKNEYALENIYNADEAGWNWRSLPQKTLATGENEASGWEINEERVTVMFCSNATGTHKIPALVIGKHQKPRCFNNITNLPVIYKAQTNAWMDRFVFMEWYTECFIPSVRTNQENINQRGKVLLILDNDPSHIPADELNAVDKDFAIMYFPPNVTALIQPMDQGIIETAKKIYKRCLAQRFLLRDDEIPLTEFIEQLTLKDCCEMVAASWEEVTCSKLQKAWKNLIHFMTPIKDEITNENNFTDEYLRTIINTIPGIYVSEVEFEDWLHKDDANQTSEPLNDNQIVTFVKNKHENNHNDDERFQISKAVDEIKPEEIFITPPISAQNAVTGITLAYTWLETQPECTKDDLIVLNKLRNLAEKKALCW